MTDTEKRRLFVGGLHHGLKEEDLRERFGRHGTISSLEIKTKKDTKGNPIKTFAHMDITLTEKELKKCMNTYNNTKWNGNTLQIQMAKESFLTRLERERTSSCSTDKEEAMVRTRKPPHQVAAEKRLEENFEKAGVTDFAVKGKVPGTQIEGEKNWVVGKYGRVLPIVYIRRKDKQKVVCCDPSKFSHHLKKFKDDDKKDEGISMSKVEHLTWNLPESHTEVSLKRKGIFPQARPLTSQRKRMKNGLEADKRVHLAYGNLSVRGAKTYDSSLTDSDFDDDDNDDDDDIEKDRFPFSEDKNEESVLLSAGDAKLPTDFEIVSNSAFSFVPKAKSKNSMFESEPGYDSDDRDSVDTDELCTLVRSSKNSAGSQMNENLKRKEASKAASSSTGDEQAGGTRMKVMKQAQGKEEERDMCKQSRFESTDDSRTRGSLINIGKGGSNATCDEGDSWSNDDAMDGKGHAHSEEEDDENDTNSDEDAALDVSDQDENCPNDDDDPVPSLSFEPLILDRSHLKGYKNTTGLPQNQGRDEDGDEEEDDDEDADGDEGDDIDEEESEDKFHKLDAGKDRCSTQDSDEEDIDQETLGSPIARFDFEPLILDRIAIRKSMGTQAIGGLPDVGFHTIEKKVSDDGGTDEDSEEDDSAKSSNESTDEGEEDIEEDDNTVLEENGSKLKCNTEISNSTNVEDKSKTLSKVTTVATPQTVENPFAGSEPKSDTINQEKRDKSGRLLSKAAKKKLAREEAEKQRESNERRLESMKQQQRALLDRKSAIKGALSAVDDKDKKQGKHITFDSDDEDQESETASGKDEILFAEQKIKGNISLFESESSSDDEEEKDAATENKVKKIWNDDSSDDDGDDDRFKIKPQYEGEAGQKLINMEARYGGDNRFKLDTRFLDDEDERTGTGAKADVTEDAEDDPSSGDLQEEKRRSLAILQNMLGTPVVASSKPVEPNFKDPSQLHYDPSRDEHSKYELQEDDEDESDAKKLEQEMRREKKKMEEERAKIPEVSKEKFFQVSSNLKDAFSGGGGGKEDSADGGGGTFTFFGGNDSDHEDEDPQSTIDENATVTDLASSLFPSKRFKYDSSDDEDDDDEETGVDSKKNKDTENAAEEDSENTSVQQAFFFQTDDPRLTAGSQKFCRPKDQDEMMSRWEEMKAQLQNDFRKRHQKAVRDQKTSKKWLKKPAKSKK